MNARPIHEVFRKRAQRIGFVLKNRIGRFHGWNPKGEPMHVQVHDADGGAMLIQFQRKSDPRCFIEFGNVTADGTANTRYGEETVLKAEDLGAVTAHYDNTTGFRDVELEFRDLFAKEDSKETDKSGGTSTKITLEAEENVEGFASFKESIEQEVHAEFAEREGSKTTNEREGEEATACPVGKKVVIQELRKRADTELEVTSDAQFSFNLKCGSHDPRFNHGWKRGGPPHKATWATWQDFCDVIKGEAADNIDLAENFQRHPAHHYDLSVLDPLEGEVKYKIRFEGKIIKSYTVRGYNADGTPYQPLDQG